MSSPTPAVICLTSAGHELAQRIADVVEGEVQGRAGRTDARITFDDTVEHIRAMFAAGRPVIGICAAGILIRAVAPLLGDKWSEPPVIAVSEDGAYVVPLLGGHHGANRLAAEIAPAIYGTPAVTTAGDTRFGIALDEPPAGWVMQELTGSAKDLAAAILNGSNITVRGAGTWAETLATACGTPLSNHPESALPMFGAGRQDDVVLLGALTAPDGAEETTAHAVAYHSQRLAIGVGCARNCDTEELLNLVNAALIENDLCEATIAGIFSVDLKADEAAILALAERFGRPIRLFSAAELEEETSRLANPSDVVFAEVGCHGVAEAAALRAAGLDAQLIVEKQKSANATVAIARASQPIVELKGRKRGQVSLIGIGPGQAAWRTPEASRLVASADELVGYGFYIDLLGPLARGKRRANFPLGGEEDRCRYALEEAAKGREIAIICSGDAGIYAMGALVYELMARQENGVSAAARRVEVVSAPGISALQAASARAGALLGHDFCTISLSDLLTPRRDIEQRLQAAAEGDFVIAFYNPVSKRRRDLFVKAIDMLCDHRPPDTPVVLATSLGRPEENVRLRRLDEVHVDEVDMMTVVIVGSSQSGLVRVGGADRAFTPRGYAVKHEIGEPC